MTQYIDVVSCLMMIQRDGCIQGARKQSNIVRNSNIKENQAHLSDFMTQL